MSRDPPGGDRLRIRYRFLFPDGTETAFDIGLDAETLQLVDPAEDDLPGWTRLQFHQCPHCPLSADLHPACPVAARLAPLVPRFDELQSHSPVRLEVETRERTVSRDTTVQTALASLMGLLMATSGCPHTAPLRPMARFHLPLATAAETTFRAATMYLLAQYFRRTAGLGAELDFQGLTRIYERMQVLNRAMAGRLAAVTRTDSSSNAVVVLDVFAQTLPMAVEDSLEVLRPIYRWYLEGDGAGEGAGGEGR